MGTQRKGNVEWVLKVEELSSCIAGLPGGMLLLLVQPLQ
jgi:hypothetical protein